MATWQYDFWLAPREAVAKQAERQPLRQMRDAALGLRDSDLWANRQPAGLEAELSTVLPEGKAWTGRLRIWGAEDGDRVEVLYNESALVTDIGVRVDARSVSLRFISFLCNLARRHEWVIVSSDGDVVEPAEGALYRLITRSASGRFAHDPKEALRDFGFDEDGQ